MKKEREGVIYGMMTDGEKVERPKAVDGLELVEIDWSKENCQVSIKGSFFAVDQCSRIKLFSGYGYELSGKMLICAHSMIYVSGNDLELWECFKTALHNKPLRPRWVAFAKEAK